MKIRIISALAVCTLAFLSAKSPAQQVLPTSGQLSPERSDRVRGVTDSTYLMPPYNPRQGKVIDTIENEFRPPWYGVQGEGNTLPVGEAENPAAGRMQGRFPTLFMNNWHPADPTLGVGPNHVVVTANVQIGFYTKAGAQTFQQSLGTFFQSTGSGPEQDLFDPKVFYDKETGRFFVVCLEQSGTTVSKVLVAVSDDSDPNGSWHKYRFEAKWTANGSTYWLDYPGWGHNKDAIICTGNLFRMTGGGPGFGGCEIIVIQKSALLSGGTATTFYFNDTASFGIQPAQMFSSTADRIYMMSDVNTSTARVHSMTNLLGTPVYNFANIAVPSFSYPNGYATSAGGHNLDPLDGRVLTSNWRNGKLLYSQGVRSGTQYRNRWYEINTNNYPSASPTLVQSGNVASGNGAEHFIMPAICSNEFMDYSMLFTRCSSSIVADVMQASRKVGDAAGTFGAPVFMTASTGTTYGNSTNMRWGDYFAVVTDPVNDTTFWGVAMRGNNPWWVCEVVSWNVTAPVVLNSVTLDNPSVIGGTNTIGRVNLSGNAPPGGYVVTLNSSNTSACTVPANVTVPEGANTAAFTITTLVVNSDTSSTIKGTFRGVEKTATQNVLWATQTVNPSAFSKLGDQLSGNLNSLFAIDANRIQLKVSVASDTVPPIQLTVLGTSPIANPSKFEFKINTRTSIPGRTQRIFLFDYVNNRWELMFTGSGPTVDTTKVITVTTNVSNFIQSGTRSMRARVDMDDFASEEIVLWSFFIDQSVWTIFR